MTSVEYQGANRAFLFKNLVPLSRQAHGHLGLCATPSFREYHFHWLPIVLSEVQAVAPHFPIVVLGESQTPMLAALVGLRQRHCLFIDRHGNWNGAYIPLYLRQMPFQIMRLRDPDAPPNPVICVDVDSALVDDCFEEKIVAAGAVSTACESRLEAAKTFGVGVDATTAFAQALVHFRLTVPLAALPAAADCAALGALFAVSGTALRDAPAPVLAQFTKNNTQAPLRICAASLGNLIALRRRDEAEIAAETAHARADL